jgi:Carboxypeptidase regulatory-like domain
MNKIQNSKIEMFKAVRIHCKRNEHIMVSLPALEKVYHTLGQQLENITAALRLQEKVITGIVIDKARSRKLLTEDVLDIANALSAYAAQTQDHILLKETDTSVSRVNHMSDESFYRFCTNTIAMAMERSGLLKEYGVTGEQLTLLTEKSRVFHENSSSPRNAISERSASRKNITQLIRETNTLLNSQMDALVRPFRKTEPDFYNAYISNRKTILLPGTITQLKGTVLSARGKKPLTGISIELLNDAGETLISSLSNTSGNYLLKGLPVGSFTVKAADEEGNEKLVKGVEVHLGKVNRLDIAF